MAPLSCKAIREIVKNYPAHLKESDWPTGIQAECVPILTRSTGISQGKESPRCSAILATMA